MPLPRIPLPTRDVEVGGSTVVIHALTRAQAIQLNDYQDRYDEAEDFLLSCATDVSLEEAHAWRELVDFDTVGTLVDAIVELSGLTDQPMPVARSPK